MDYTKYNLFEKECVNAVIEITKGTNKKKEITLQGDRLTVVRKTKWRYPFYYGFFPQTLADDGDQLDAIIVSDKKHKELEIVKVRPIAVIKTVDNGGIDDKVICVVDGESVDINYKRIFKFLKKYKGKKAFMNINETIQGVEVANKLIKSTNQKFIQTRATNRR